MRDADQEVGYPRRRREETIWGDFLYERKEGEFGVDYFFLFNPSQHFSCGVFHLKASV